MKKIVTVIGARPQFVKAAVVSRAIEKKANEIEEVIVHTGQHFDSNMSSVFFDELKIPKPKYNLGIGGGSHGKNTGEMLASIESVLISESPDAVLVFGDTDSTLAGGLAASKLNIPVYHVEAGLRSFNRRMPEEINRVLTDHVSEILFCPSEVAVKNLKNEGIDKSAILVGDVMYDAALYYSSLSKEPVSISKPDNDFLLCTIHRAENTDDYEKLSSIFEGLREVGENINIVLPIHPRTQKKIQEFNISTQGIEIIEPVGYLEMIWLIKNSKLVITDSGGLQKEAFFFDKYCVTLREETEWVELVEGNYNVLVGSDKSKIISEIKTKLISSKKINSQLVNLYGTGDTGDQIVERILGES